MTVSLESRYKNDWSSAEKLGVVKVRSAAMLARSVGLDSAFAKSHKLQTLLCTTRTRQDAFRSLIELSNNDPPPPPPPPPRMYEDGSKV